MTDTRLKYIAKYYGLNNQLNKAVEEMAELITAASRYTAGDISVKENLIEEIADVEIMTEQLKVLLDCENKVNDIKDFKLARQIKRIEEE